MNGNVCRLLAEEVRRADEWKCMLCLLAEEDVRCADEWKIYTVLTSEKIISCQWAKKMYYLLASKKWLSRQVKKTCPVDEKKHAHVFPKTSAGFPENVGMFFYFLYKKSGDITCLF